MVVKFNVEGLEEFKNEVDKHQGKTIFVLFSGTPNDDSENWCPDCVNGKRDIIKTCLQMYRVF